MFHVMFPQLGLDLLRLLCHALLDSMNRTVMLTKHGIGPGQQSFKCSLHVFHVCQCVVLMLLQVGCFHM